jgi:hypothetical protein
MPTFPRDSIITISGVTGAGTSGGTITLSDHNRSSLQLYVDRIENKRRMVNGTMRKNVVATKKRWACSWENLPSLTSKTVDGYAGAAAVKSLYENNVGKMTMTIRYDSNGALVSEVDDVMISSFSYEVNSRSGTFDLVNVSIEFEEV